MTFQEYLDYALFSIGEYQLTVARLLLVSTILLATIVIKWVMGFLLRSWYNRKHVDEGRRYVINQLLKYILYTLAILLVFQALGVKLSLLWGGAAALLVGVGLGLQQTFNDLFSGIILLVESSIEVGDIVMIDQMTARVNSIGLRTSKVETRDNIVIIIPNSKLVSENVVNWTHNDQATRFSVGVGVSYQSDVDLVTKLLLQAAAEHPSVLKTPAPSVQFANFGNSSLDFILLFYTEEYFRFEFIRSELRYKIHKLFHEHGVEIPFPQRDLWLRNPEALGAFNQGKP